MAIIENAIYRQYPALNASYLKQVYSHSKWHADIPMTETPAMALGTAIHARVLEPDVFTTDYALFDGDRRTKTGKAEYAELLEQGMKILNWVDWNKCEVIAGQVKQHPDVFTLLVDAHLVEASMTFESPYFRDLECKAQIDLFTNDGILVDVKTTNDMAWLQHTFFKFHYDLQLKYYKDALQANGFKVNEVKVWFIETSPPHQMALLDVENDVLDIGKEKVIAAIRKYEAQKNQPMPELIKGKIYPK